MTRQSRPRILVVDDNQHNVKRLEKMLAAQDYDVVVAYDGKGALKQVVLTPPDLVVLDVLMPGMDGFQVAQALRDRAESRAIPILMVTALNELDDKVKAFSLGGVDYITKPFQAEEVLARIKTHLTLRSLQKNLEDKNAQLQKALDEIKTLQGIIPICANCKKIRNDKGFWEHVEKYISDHTDALFTHGLCPECIRTLYPDIKVKKKDY